MRICALTAAILAITLIGGCKTAVPIPSREARHDSFANLTSSLRLRYGPGLAEIYADSVVTTWGDVTASGVDQVAENWWRILTGAQVEQASRTIASSTNLGAQMLRDSGSIVLRLKNTGGPLGFRDSTMHFITRWVRENRPSRWVIANDSIIP